MLDSFTDTLVNTINTNVWLAPLAALVGGLLTALNPCVLGAIPLMMAYVAGQESRSTARSFLLSLAFVAGLTLMFALMSLSVFVASAILPAGWWQYIAAAVCLLMGLHLLGVLSFTIPAPAGIKPSQRGFVGALLLGMLFGLASIPCAGPILGALVAIIPLKGAAFGGVLLVAYSLGHCAVILVAGTSMGLVQKMITSKGLEQVNIWSKRAVGVLVILVGVFLLVR
ncbi:MAG: cytochrome c biogenesis CcdA family protein [Planctomycetota bacterium]